MLPLVTSVVLVTGDLRDLQPFGRSVKRELEFSGSSTGSENVLFEAPRNRIDKASTILELTPGTTIVATAADWR
jgi:hypothetical protein